VQRDGASGTDWRDAASYAALSEADRSLFAWEWLRRSPRYAAAARGMDGGGADAAAKFGLVRFEAPQLAVPHARPLWSAQVHPHVLRVERGPAGRPEDSFDLADFGAIATLFAGGGAEHLLLSDGLRTVRLDGAPGTFSHGPVCLAYRLHGAGAAERPLLTLRRFLSLCRSGRFSSSLHPREARARRWILVLRAADALAAGAGQREIASELLSRTAGEPQWRSREPSVRSQAQRLVASARSFARGGYRSLLG